MPNKILQVAPPNAARVFDPDFSFAPVLQELSASDLCVLIHTTRWGKSQDSCTLAETGRIHGVNIRSRFHTYGWLWQEERTCTLLRQVVKHFRLFSCLSGIFCMGPGTSSSTVRMSYQGEFVLCSTQRNRSLIQITQNVSIHNNRPWIFSQSRSFVKSFFFGPKVQVPTVLSPKALVHHITARIIRAHSTDRLKILLNALDDCGQLAKAWQRRRHHGALTVTSTAAKQSKQYVQGKKMLVSIERTGGIWCVAALFMIMLLLLVANSWNSPTSFWQNVATTSLHDRCVSHMMLFSFFLRFVCWEEWQQTNISLSINWYKHVAYFSCPPGN